MVIFMQIHDSLFNRCVYIIARMNNQRRKYINLLEYAFDTNIDQKTLTNMCLLQFQQLSDLRYKLDEKVTVRSHEIAWQSFQSLYIYFLPM